MSENNNKERIALITLFISASVSIFGAGVLYQKANENEKNIALLIAIDEKLTEKNENVRDEIHQLSERITKLESKIDALDKWCRNNLWKKQ